MYQCLLVLVLKYNFTVVIAIELSSLCTADLDECTSMNICDVNAECNDTIGSFTCACNDGYTGDGFSCTGMCSAR